MIFYKWLQNSALKINNCGLIGNFIKMRQEIEIALSDISIVFDNNLRISYCNNAIIEIQWLILFIVSRFLETLHVYIKNGLPLIHYHIIRASIWHPKKSCPKLLGMLLSYTTIIFSLKN